MNVAHELLKAALAAGVIVEAAGEKLKLRAKAAPPADLLAALREHKPEILVALGQPRPTPDEPGTHWLLIDSGQVFRLPFQQPRTRAELLQRYPGCLVVRLPDMAQARELTELLGRIAAHRAFSQEDIDEALEHALRDPEAALECFRALVLESRS